MQGSQLNNSTLPQSARNQAHHFAKLGAWPMVFNILMRDRGIAYSTDRFEKSAGWTLTDHAVYQVRMGALKTLRQRFDIFGQPRSEIILYHVQNQNWPWILQLLKEDVVSANSVFMLPKGERRTLLELAKQQALQGIVNFLRNQYAAKTAEELDELIAAEQMFKAARRKDWRKVYQLLDSKATSVDVIDRWENENWVLLQYAYEQRDQDAVVKLIDHYHADTNEIRNQDRLLYDGILELYEQAHAAYADAIMKKLAETMDAISLSDDLPVVNLGCTLQFKTIAPFREECGIHLLHRDYPGVDEIYDLAKKKC